MYRLKKKFKNEKGQGLVEYGLILALVSIVAILVLSMLGGSIKGQLEEITASMGGISEPGKVPGDSDGEIDDLIANHNFIPVATADELNNVRSATLETYGKGTKWEGPYTGGLDKQYIQVADIDLSGIENFEPIGEYDDEFKGIYDGGGYAISNLTIRVTERYTSVGLFGQAIGATFKNIGLVNVNVTGVDYVGGLVGNQVDSSVSNSYATGSVTGKDYVGGLVGTQYSTSVTDSYATGSVTGGRWTGGLVGTQSDSSTVTNSYATGSVTGTGDTVGGLVGNQDGSSVTNSYATGSVNGVDNVGGLVGVQDGSSTTNSYAMGSVTGTGDNIGGLVGKQWWSSTVSNSYATGSVTGTKSWTGGLVGYQRDSSVSNSYYDQETTKQSDTGKGTGKTTVEMKNKDTYVDWDFESIWTIESNQYPTLR